MWVPILFSATATTTTAAAIRTRRRSRNTTNKSIQFSGLIHVVRAIRPRTLCKKIYFVNIESSFVVLFQHFATFLFVCCVFISFFSLAMFWFRFRYIQARTIIMLEAKLLSCIFLMVCAYQITKNLTKQYKRCRNHIEWIWWAYWHIKYLIGCVLAVCRVCARYITATIIGRVALFVVVFVAMLLCMCQLAGTYIHRPITQFLHKTSNNNNTKKNHFNFSRSPVCILWVPQFVTYMCKLLHGFFAQKLWLFEKKKRKTKIAANKSFWWYLNSSSVSRFFYFANFHSSAFFFDYFVLSLFTGYF